MDLEIISTDTSITMQGQPVYFYVGDHKYLEPKDIRVERRERGYKFSLSTDRPTTIVFPCLTRRVYIGDNYEELNTRQVSEYYCEGPTAVLSKERAVPAYSSAVHLVADNAWTVSVYGESRIAVFKQFYEQYASITGIPDRDHIIFYVDVAENRRVNLYRCPVKRRKIRYVGALDFDDLQSALYYGASLVRDQVDPSAMVEKAQEVQNTFDKAQLYTVITGALARHLNGIECNVGDIDIMFRDRPSAAHGMEILKDSGYQVQKQTPWLMRMVDKSGVQIDLSYDNFRLLQLPHYVRHTHGFRFFDIEGLLWLALLSLQEFPRLPDQRGYQRNDRALFELTTFAYLHGFPCNNKIAESIDNIDKRTRRGEELCRWIENEPLLLADVRANEPFRVNCFGSPDSNTRYYPVILTGAPSDCRIVTPFKPTEAIWYDVTGRESTARIHTEKDFCLIFIDKLSSAGILVAKAQPESSEPEVPATTA